jgi:hypothetical protein
MASPSPVSPAIVRDVTAFVRTLVTAARSHQMYAPQHPTAVAAVERCRMTIGALATYDDLVIGVTPETLLASGQPLPVDARIREGCALLNDHDILTVRVLAEPSSSELLNFLTLLGFDPDAIRRRGGPAKVWAEYGRFWLQIGQIDYDRLLTSAAPGSLGTIKREPAGAVAAPVERDHIWRSLVRTLADGRGSLERQAERRLMDIAHSAEAIAELADDAAASQTSEGAALEAAQAAAVLMTFQRLSSFVEMHAPQDLDDVTANIATAAARTSPPVLMRAMADAAESGVGTDMVQAIGGRFDDTRVATFLAGAMAEGGQAPARIAAALNTLVPDAERRQRVVRLARIQSEDQPSRLADDVSSTWTTLERLLAGPADEAYVSRLYGETLEHVEARANRVRLDAPAKLDAWMRSVSAESVRTLSATLLIDLFGLERTPAAVFETAQDLALLAEDLLIVGDIIEAERVASALAASIGGQDVERASAARSALAKIVSVPALAEAIADDDEIDATEYDALQRLCLALRPQIISLLLDTFVTTTPGTGRARTEALLLAFGNDVAAAIATAIAEADAEHTIAWISLLSRLGNGPAIAVLLSLAKSPDTERSVAAVKQLASLEDFAAVRALATLLRAGGPQTRDAVIDALSASRHPRASTLLTAEIGEHDPLGSDHHLVLRLLAALSAAADRDAVPSLVRLLHVRSWLAWRRARNVRRAAARVLAAMRAPEGRKALELMAANSTGQLRRDARAALRGRI